MSSSFSISNNIDKFFERSGLTKSELAKRSGLSYQNVIRILSYKKIDNAKLRTIVVLALALDVSIDELVGFEDLKEMCKDVDFSNESFGDDDDESVE